MKKIILIFVILFTVKAYSQTISYGISAGLNYTNLPGNSRLLYSLSNDYMAGFRVGGLMDIGFKAFSIQPGILFTTMGGQGKIYYVNYVNGNSTITGYTTNKIVLDYIEVPINFLYRIKTSGGSVFIGGGPYVGIGISGKTSYEISTNNVNNYNLIFGSNYSDMKNPDIGLNALMGYRLNLGLALSAGYSTGLTDTYNSGANNKNKGFNVSVDYFF